MSLGLNRYHQTGDLHFITFSCFRKRNILGTSEARDRFVEIFEQTRQKYLFHINGYVIMPNHVHILVSEPKSAPLSLTIQILKQRFSRTRTEDYVWETRYYDFNVRTEPKRIEKLRYIHRNPVTRGLVTEPGHWQWSSFNAHATNDAHPILITR
ncbi:transposase [Tunturiibacter empetritectus]|uniref:Transposase n=1 Tax=Tunturiibacter lichenicola TaxID=2051959 RepID=A0A852VHL5_9BACT|nr:transposase [Edaphobacter lichenicola]NYF90681.1 putative transposase [Edaphobacter lichenicola]